MSGDLGKNLKLYAKWRKMEYSVKLGYTGTIYTGKTLTPSVTVKDEYGNTLKKGTDYTVTISNNKNVGVGKVVVTFKGLPYKLTKTLRFKIYPKAPTSCKATLTGYDDVKLTWSKSTQADGYKVYYRKSTASKFSLYKSTTSTSVVMKDLADGVKYIFKVVPYFTTSDGTKYESTKYAACSAFTLKQISKPTLSVSGTKVKVTWKNIEGESGYQISRSAAKGKTNIISTYKTTDGKTKSFSAPFGKAYYYKVRAYKVVNDKNVYGPWSTEVKYTRNLAAPTTVKATLYGYDDVKVTWSKVSEADGYTVYYKKDGDSSYKTKGNTTSTSMKIADLADGVKYYVKVVPYSKTSGKIVRSTNYKAAEVTTLKKVGTPKAVESDGKIKVSWTNIAGESGYQISQATTKTGTNIVATYKTTGGKSKVISAENEKVYYYKVRAYKTVGDTNVYGPWSEAVSAKVSKPGSVTLSLYDSNGTTCMLKAKTYPADATVTWSSSDTSVATVDDGTVTAKCKGETTITAEITYNGKKYSDSMVVTVAEDISYGPWSYWSSVPAYASSTLEVETAPIYRYYCFYCPVCGGREPLSGNSDCYAYTLTGGDWQEFWSPIPYSQCGATQWPLASGKMYTTSLGDGLLWNFSTGNLWHTAIGTVDTGSGAVVIQQGYRWRTVTTSYVIGDVK